ncbi:hypothetical protein CBR_g44483 [Chara braunii]|uniref:Cupin type-1 domain-containing protein n=1 Tax=Chara braunii TaxID=69332 RepID=A0A388LXI8_CHABU|nr:hypothetical protein CBR_g44483 [Chara braunii]|eukprot:GBG87026.1 hypothetical protein CBR_g44483 [Chara braunii]
MALVSGSLRQSHRRANWAVVCVGLVILVSVAQVMAITTGTSASKGQFEYGRPYDVAKTDGGSLSLWSESFEELTKHGAHIVAGHLTLEANGFALPALPFLDEVLTCSAHVGLMTPMGISAAIQRISEGDVVVIPRGWASWACNRQERRFKALFVADLSEHAGISAKESSFALAGSMKDLGEGWRQGSVLHGFTKDVLAAAWDVEERDVEKLLNSQRESVITKVSREAAESYVSSEPSAAGFVGEFIYSLKNSQPDVFNEGGEFHLVNRNKLQTLHKYGTDFAVAFAKLNKGAIGAPGWCVNAHHIVYFTKGSGRFQIAHPDGSNALDAHVRAGSVIVVPRFHAAVVLASKEEELEYVVVSTSSLPIWVNMAGQNSVFQNMPATVVKEAFNISEDLLEKLRHRRTSHSIILPAPTTSEQKQREPVEAKKPSQGLPYAFM